MGYLSQLGYVGIEAQDLGGWEKLLAGLDVQVAPTTLPAGTALLARLDELAYRLVITEGRSDDVSAIGWEVPGREPMAQLVAAAAAHGVNLERASEDEISVRGVVDLWWGNDPIGIRHEVYCGPTIDDTRRLDRTLAGRFRTGSLGFGHATLYAPTAVYDQALAFYRDALGLVESGRRDCTPDEGTPICLMRCNARQHSLAVVECQDEPSKKLAHVYIEYAQLDFLGQAYDSALDLDLVSVSLGRHQADHAVSFYATTPSGTELELGWDSRLINDAGRIEKFRAQRQPSIWGHRRTAS